MTTVAVIGSWQLAHVTAACLAESGHGVALVNETGVWDHYPQCPVDEPGVDELAGTLLAKGSLTWTTLHPDKDSFGTLGMCALVKTLWLAIDTPLDVSGAPDVGPLCAAVEAAEVRFPNADLIVVGSQVPLGFCAKLEGAIGKPVACVPENMRIGDGLRGFRHPDRLIIGAARGETRGVVAAMLLAPAGTEVIACSLETAEMCKHATNAFLATSISFANEVAAVGAAYDVDSEVVTRALRADRRIGPKAYVRSGDGFANGTLERDLRVLQRAGIEHHVSTKLVDAVLAVNDQQAKPAPTPHEQHLKGRQCP